MVGQHGTLARGLYRRRAIPVDVRPDWMVFGFAAAVSLATGVLFGIAPALRATRIDPGPAMKDNSRQTTRIVARVGSRAGGRAGGAVAGAWWRVRDCSCGRW
jgi:hypothetical protein